MGERVRYELDMGPDEVLARLRANTVDAADKRAMFRAMLSSGPWMSARIDGHSFRLHQHRALLTRDPEFGHLDGSIRAIPGGTRVDVELKHFGWNVWPPAVAGVAASGFGIALLATAFLAVIEETLRVPIILMGLFAVALPVWLVLVILRAQRARKKEFLEFVAGLFHGAEGWQLGEYVTTSDPRPLEPESLPTPTKARRQASAEAELLALCRSIIHDRVISKQEIVALRAWLKAHRDSGLPAIDSLTDTIERITADRRVTKEERLELYQALEAVLRGEATKEAAQQGSHVAREEREAARAAIQFLTDDAAKEAAKQESDAEAEKGDAARPLTLRFMFDCCVERASLPDGEPLLRKGRMLAKKWVFGAVIPILLALHGLRCARRQQIRIPSEGVYGHFYGADAVAWGLILVAAGVLVHSVFFARSYPGRIAFRIFVASGLTILGIVGFLLIHFFFT